MRKPGSVFDEHFPTRDDLLAEVERLRGELAASKGTSGRRFAGWFIELPSGMSYRLWEQGGPEWEPGYVALYEG
jgi:hypothetical protein